MNLIVIDNQSSNKMKKQSTVYLFIVVILMIFWGLFGFMEGDGFFGGIAKQIYVIADFILLIFFLFVKNYQ